MLTVPTGAGDGTKMPPFEVHIAVKHVIRLWQVLSDCWGARSPAACALHPYVVISMAATPQLGVRAAQIRCLSSLWGPVIAI